MNQHRLGFKFNKLCVNLIFSDNQVYVFHFVIKMGKSRLFKKWVMSPFNETATFSLFIMWEVPDAFAKREWSEC